MMEAGNAGGGVWKSIVLLRITELIGVAKVVTWLMSKLRKASAMRAGEKGLVDALISC